MEARGRRVEVSLCDGRTGCPGRDAWLLVPAAALPSPVSLQAPVSPSVKGKAWTGEPRGPFQAPCAEGELAPRGGHRRAPQVCGRSRGLCDMGSHGQHPRAPSRQAGSTEEWELRNTHRKRESVGSWGPWRMLGLLPLARAAPSCASPAESNSKTRDNWPGHEVGLWG